MSKTWASNFGDVIVTVVIDLATKARSAIRNSTNRHQNSGRNPCGTRVLAKTVIE